MTDKLPPLPEPWSDFNSCGCGDYAADECPDLFTFEQLHAYALAAVMAERERAAQAACDFLTRGRNPLGRAVADAIRQPAAPMEAT